MNSSSRYSPEESLLLLTEKPLADLCKEAHRFRMALLPDPVVSYVLDSNPNYTNICDTACTFCSFYRKASDTDAFFKTPQEVIDTIYSSVKTGAKTILLQGGLSKKITIEYFLDIVKIFFSTFPEIHPHFFSAPEIACAASNSNISIEQALKKLFSAGLRTIPGAGAEILSSAVHQKICKNKLPPENWCLIHKKAHEIGFKTTATMMFGHIETEEDILTHLLSLRAIQDETAGFFSFIPWSFKPANNFLGKTIPQIASSEKYLRIIAASRLILDNFPHIGASWFGEGKEAGIQALLSGADDFGGILLEESVHKAASYVNRSSEAEVLQLIRKAGFEPKERNSFYQFIPT